jgi:hypothetical protein
MRSAGHLAGGDPRQAQPPRLPGARRARRARHAAARCRTGLRCPRERRRDSRRRGLGSGRPGSFAFGVFRRRPPPPCRTRRWRGRRASAGVVGAQLQARNVRNDRRVFCSRWPWWQRADAVLTMRDGLRFAGRSARGDRAPPPRVSARPLLDRVRRDPRERDVGGGFAASPAPRRPAARRVRRPSQLHRGAFRPGERPHRARHRRRGAGPDRARRTAPAGLVRAARRGGRGDRHALARGGGGAAAGCGVRAPARTTEAATLVLDSDAFQLRAVLQQGDQELVATAAASRAVRRRPSVEAPPAPAR